MNSLDKMKRELNKLKNPQKAKILSRFFKTGKGEYAEGDIFLGLTVPQERQVAKRYPHLTLKELEKLLSSKIHEYRLTALVILVNKYRKADNKEKRGIFNFYLARTKNINNWDLVDLSTSNIVGSYLLNEDKSILYKLAKSKNLWERRIAILSTYAFIKNGQFADTLKISKILLSEEHDLIHKAVGWMLREVGKRDQKILEDFLKNYSQKMPRIMLRYAVEKFSEEKRKFYMKSPINNSGTTNLA